MSQNYIYGSRLRTFDGVFNQLEQSFRADAAWRKGLCPGGIPAGTSGGIPRFMSQRIRSGKYHIGIVQHAVDQRRKQIGQGLHLATEFPWAHFQFLLHDRTKLIKRWDYPMFRRNSTNSGVLRPMLRRTGTTTLLRPNFSRLVVSAHLPLNRPSRKANRAAVRILRPALV